jgi:hypothetical protein
MVSVRESAATEAGDAERRQEAVYRWRQQKSRIGLELELLEVVEGG